MSHKKSIASLSLDLDNQWSYMKTHGDPGWELFPSYFNLLIPRVLQFLRERDLKITFFIVGQDAALEKNTQALRAIAAAGHEIGNHSFRHEPWLHLYTEDQIETELAIAEKHIELATGHRPVCFRGPGFSLSRTVLNVLTARDYLCDASTFPTFLGPLARAYYFMTSKLSSEELAQRKELFGKFQDGFRPLKPYRLSLDGGSIVELPVTTMPVVKVPIHASYILYLSVFSPTLAMIYFRLAISLCRLMQVQPSILLHPLDFLGGDDLPELAFFPAMNLPSQKKVAMMSRILHVLTQHYTVLTVGQHAQQIAQQGKMPLMHPSAIAL
jgi:peptidoglycan-N-acetylglucosamine deacetylase